MEDMSVNIIKAPFVVVFCSIMAHLEPVYNPMILLLCFALIDIIVGRIASIRVDHEKFKIKKFMLAACYSVIYLSMIVLIYTVGYLQNDVEESLYVVKMVTYVFVYFYGTNILRNLCNIFPYNKTLKFFFFVFGLEFTKRISWLNLYFSKHKDEQIKLTEEEEEEEEKEQQTPL